MKKTRLKLSAPAIKTREEMDRLVGKISEYTIDRDLLKTTMDQRLQDVRDQYAEQLGEIESILDSKMALAQDWAEANPSEFGNKKSIEFLHGTIGWRTGTPKLKTLSGWTWDRVKEAIKGIPKFAVNYLRQIEEINKEALLADREIIEPEILRVMGVKVVQDESFFCDPKREKKSQELKEVS